MSTNNTNFRKVTGLSLRGLMLVLSAAVISACGNPEPIAEARYVQPDQFFTQIEENLAGASRYTMVKSIDHSRLAQQVGSVMPPAKVLIFSDPQLETQLIQMNPLSALDLPLRVLSYEDPESEAARVIYNSFDYLISRYQLDAEATVAARENYGQAMTHATAGLPEQAIASFSQDEMRPDGIVTISSPYGFQETVERVNAAIESQDDTVNFGIVDFQANAAELGVEIAPSYMILFGGPGPGGKAMAAAPTLGLDGFCQKFLIWEDADRSIKLSFNDLLALAERQGVPKSPALRIINYRLTKVFEEALSAD